MNRTQALVLGFLGFAWIGLVSILLIAPEIYDASLNLDSANRRLGEISFLAALSVFITWVAFGVVRRWRWTFWVMLVASLAGVLRTLASILQLTGLRDRLSAIDDARKLTEQDHRELQAAGAALAALREKDAALEKQVKDAEAERREVLRELLHLRERLAKLEGQQEAKPAGAKGPPADPINKIDGDK